MRSKILFGVLACLLISAGQVLAKEPQVYFDDALKLLDDGKTQEAIALFKEGLKEYPDNPGLVLSLADSLHTDKNHQEAIVYYLKAAALIKENTPAALHFSLADCYNEIGQKHYFSPEACLRIIYHVEKYLESESNVPDKTSVMEFLRKSLGHYAAAAGGTKILETGGDGAEFQLPADNISQEDKIQSKDKAAKRLADYDASKPKLYETQASDKTAVEIAEILKSETGKISSFQYVQSSADSAIQEVWYKAPDKFKSVYPDEIMIVSGAKLYSIDPAEKKVNETLDINAGDVDYFNILGKPDLSAIGDYYQVSAAKIKTLPEMLKPLYPNAAPANLYLLTAVAKPGQIETWPPTNKIEFVIDLDMRLVVARREYWQGVIGSGKDEELAEETVFVKTQKTEAGVYFPEAGITESFIEELGKKKEAWSLLIKSINKDIPDSEFDSSKYSQ